MFSRVPKGLQTAPRGTMLQPRSTKNRSSSKSKANPPMYRRIALTESVVVADRKCLVKSLS